MKLRKVVSVGVRLAALVYVVQIRVVGIHKNRSDHNLPSLYPGDYVLVNHWTSVHDLRRGDLISIIHPYTGETVFRRVAALYGDRSPDAPETRVPYGHVFLLTERLSSEDTFSSTPLDSPSPSTSSQSSTTLLDSRHFGPLPLGLVQGRLFAKVPFPSPPFSLFLFSSSSTSPHLVLLFLLFLLFLFFFSSVLANNGNLAKGHTTTPSFIHSHFTLKNKLGINIPISLVSDGAVLGLAHYECDSGGRINWTFMWFEGCLAISYHQLDFFGMARRTVRRQLVWLQHSTNTTLPLQEDNKRR